MFFFFCSFCSLTYICIVRCAILRFTIPNAFVSEPMFSWNFIVNRSAVKTGESIENREKFNLIYFSVLQRNWNVIFAARISEQAHNVEITILNLVIWIWNLKKTKKLWKRKAFSLLRNKKFRVIEIIEKIKTERRSQTREKSIAYHRI